LPSFSMTGATSAKGTVGIAVGIADRVPEMDVR
jgi:hypothetical protein